MADRTTSFLGLVEAPSGALLLGDPEHLLPNTREGVAGINAQDIVGLSRSWAAQPVGDRPVLLFGKLPVAGCFPVYGEFDEHSLVALLIDLAPDEEGTVE